MSILIGALGGAADAMLKSMEQRDKFAEEAALTDRKQNAELDRQRTLELFKNQLQKGALQEKYAMAFGGAPSSGGSTMPGMNTITDSGGQSQSSPPPGAMAGQPSDLSGRIQALAERTGVSPDAIRADLALNDGKGLSAMIEKQFGPDIQVIDGYVIDKKKIKANTFLPGVRTSANGQTSVVEVGEDGKPVVTVPPGAAEAYGTYKGIDAGVAASTKPIKVYNPATQREEYVSESAVLKAAGGQFAPQPQAQPSQGNQYKVSPQEQASRDAEAMMIKRSELKTAQAQLNDAENRGDKVAADRLRGDVIALGREITKSELQAQHAALNPSAKPLSTGGAMAAGPSDMEKAAAEALGPINRNFVEKSYQPVQEAGAAAQNIIESAKVARDAITQMGGTGFGKEARAKAANVLVGLGVGVDRAKILSENVAKFNTVAMERLQVVLNAARGPQTDPDARRAQQTFAQLGNPTDANRFVLDLAQARAERDIMRANFYADMLPEAQKAGDLAAIDRLWNQRQPSVFSMPTMKPWGVK